MTKHIDRSDNVIRLVSTGRVSLSNPTCQAILRMDAKQQALEEAEAAADLVQRIGSGSDSVAATAIEEMTQRYDARLRYVLRRQMAQHNQDVDDVIQDTWITVIERLRGKGIDKPALLAGFIYGVAKNRRREVVRSNSKHRGDGDSEMLTTLPHDGPNPEELVAGVEITRIVRQLLAELGRTKGRDRDREVLVRLYLKQQDRQEICLALDITSDHFRRVLHRAKRRLKELLLEVQQRGDLDVIPED